jgi:hypothetical protein
VIKQLKTERGCVPVASNRCAETFRVEAQGEVTAVRCRRDIAEHDRHRGTDGTVWIEWDDSGLLCIIEVGPNEAIPAVIRLSQSSLPRVYAGPLPTSIEWYTCGG